MFFKHENGIYSLARFKIGGNTDGLLEKIAKQFMAFARKNYTHQSMDGKLLHGVLFQVKPYPTTEWKFALFKL